MTCVCLTSVKCRLVTLIAGVCLVVVGVAMIFVVKLIEYRQVLQNVVLSENSTSLAYSIWKEPELPIYMQYYVFDLQNPDEVLTGAKPQLIQKGPYTYREYIKKEDITYHDNQTVSYRQYKHWTFDRQLSSGDDSETFTTANLPLLTLVESLRWEDSRFQQAAALLLRLLSERLFITKTVHQIIWGYQDEMLAAGKILMPDWIYSDFLGVYSGKNNTYDGLYSVFTGTGDWRRLGVIDTFNGTRTVPFWTTEQARMINGSDGTIGPPFMDKNKTVYSFVSDICRSVYADFADESETPNGLPMWRYTGPRSAFESGRTSAANEGFCTPAGNCLGDGLLNLTECRMFDHFHVPVIASLPHFYLADKKYLDAVVGLKPIPNQHRTDIFIEPITGLPLRIFKRLQVNAYIQSNKFVSEMGNVPNIVYPILWLNESVVVDEAHLSQLYTMLYLPMTITSVLQYALIALGTGMVLTTVFVWLYATWKRQIESEYVSLTFDSSVNT